MTQLKFKLTTESKINAWGVRLFRIEAIVDIPSRGVKKSDKGGWVEKESNLSGNAWVYGDAEVSGNVSLKAKKGFKKGWFVAVDDDETPKELHIVNGSDGYWKNTYVLGDYEIEDIAEETEAKKTETIEIGGRTYEVSEELRSALNGLKEA